MNKEFLVLFFLSLLLLSPAVRAAVPYSEIEQLRRQTIVVTAATASPHSAQVKKCKIKINESTLSGQLTAAQNQAAKQWQQIVISTDDLHDLDSKAQTCILRASCAVYHAFISAAKVEPAIQQEVEILKAAVDNKLKKMKPSSYLRAWTSVPKPCALLHQVMK